MEEWKKRLRSARGVKGLSKTSFAGLVNVSKASVTDWEKSYDTGGIKELKGPNLIKVCEVLGITPQWLLQGDGPEPKVEPPSKKNEFDPMKAFAEITAIYMGGSTDLQKDILQAVRARHAEEKSTTGNRRQNVRNLFGDVNESQE